MKAPEQMPALQTRPSSHAPKEHASPSFPGGSSLLRPEQPANTSAAINPSSTTLVRMAALPYADPHLTIRYACHVFGLHGSISAFGDQIVQRSVSGDENATTGSSLPGQVHDYFQRALHWDGGLTHELVLELSSRGSGEAHDPEIHQLNLTGSIDGTRYETHAAEARP